jgi:hypothetical protein
LSFSVRLAKGVGLRVRLRLYPENMEAMLMSKC